MPFNPSQPSSADPFGGIANSVGGPSYSNSTGGQIVNGIGYGFSGGPAGAGLFGDSTQPGLLGMGRYGVDSNAFGAVGNAGGMYGSAGAAGNSNILNGADQQAARDQQNQLIQMLMAQANGTGPSVAQQQLKQATDRNVNQTMGMMASQRGAGAGASAYQAANAGGQAGQQMASDSATLRLQEQMQAQQALGGIVGGMRGQDQSWQTTALQQKQMNDQMVQFYTSQGMSIEQANRQAQIDEQKLKMQAYQGGGGSGGGSGLSAIGSLVAML